MSEHPSPYMYQYWLVEARYKDGRVRREVVQGDPAKEAKVKENLALSWIDVVYATPLLFDENLSQMIKADVPV